MTTEDYIKLIQQQSSYTRKIAVQNLIDIYRDNWDYIIDEALENQFSQKEKKKLNFLKTKQFNIIKRVVNEISMIYKCPAKRQALIYDKNDEVVGEDELYQKIMNESNIDFVMPQVNKYVELTKNVMVRPVWRDGKMEYDIHLFNNLDIITDPNDWKKIIAIKYYIGQQLPMEYDREAVESTAKMKSGRIERVQADTEYYRSYMYILEDYNSGNYKKGYIYTFEKKGDIEVEIDRQQINYYDINGNAVLPFVLYTHDYPVDELLDFTTGNDLIDANISFAINMIHLNNLKKYQSYKQGYIIASSEEGIPPEIQGGPSDWIGIWDREGNARVGLLDLQAQIKELWQQAKEEMALVLAQYHIKPSNFELSAQPESGFSFKMSNIDKLEYRESLIPIYREKEKELFALTKIVYNADSGQKLINPQSKLKIDFAEITFPQTMQEKISKFEFEKRNNVVTVIDLMQDYNPDLAYHEAKEQVAKNKAYNDSNTSIINIPAIQPQINNEVKNKK